MTHGELRSAATRLARPLLASGIALGDRVANMCPNIPEMLCSQRRRDAVNRVPDSKWGAAKCLRCMAAGRRCQRGRLIACLKAQIARFTVPKAIELVDYLPRTSTGKLQRFAIREKEWAGAKQPHPGIRRIL